MVLLRVGRNGRCRPRSGSVAGRGTFTGVVEEPDGHATISKVFTGSDNLLDGP